MRRFVIPVLVFAASVAVYLPTLKFDFVYDDPRQIEMMESRFTWSQVPSYFATDVWSYVQDHPTNYYRPIFVIWMLVTYQLFGLSHPLWHASAILLHALAALLLYFLARRLIGDRVTAGFAGLLFAVYPIHVEAVAWVSGATEPLCAIFFFATLLCYIASRQEQEPKRARWWRIGAVASFTVAVFAKETAVVLPALIFAYAWLFPESARESRGKRARSAFFTSIPYLQVLILYFGMRFFGLGAFSRVIGLWPVKSMIATLPLTAWFYLRGLLWPVNLSLFPSMTAVRQLGFGNFVLPAIAAALVVAALLWISLRSPLAAFCSMMLVAPLLPVFDLMAFAPEDFVHDRYLYTPSAGGCLLLAIGLRAMFLLASKSRAEPRRIQAQAALIAPVIAKVAIIAILAFLTVRESQAWKDQMTLANHTVALAPQGEMAQQLLASALTVEDRYAEALPLLEQSVAAHPRNTGGHLSVGVAYLKTKNWDKAATEFRIVVTALPDSARAHLCLGMAELEMGQVSDAETDMREAIRLRPRLSVQYRGYRSFLADLLERKGDLKGALEEYNRELEEYPDEDWVLDRAVALKKRIADSQN
jgi:tetratricopeptide (TPR) repeat protein